MISKKSAAMLVALTAFTAMSNPLLAAVVVAFDDARPTLGDGGNPATFYQSSGITFSGNYYGLVGGVANGDPGNWDLNGTSGPTFLGINQGTNGSPTFNFSTPINYFKFDVGVSFGKQISFVAEAFIGGVITAAANFQITDNNSPNGTWKSVGFLNDGPTAGPTFDLVVLKMTSSANGGIAYGVDNIQLASAAVPEPTSALLTISSLAVLVCFGRVRSQKAEVSKNA